MKNTSLHSLRAISLMAVVILLSCISAKAQISTPHVNYVISYPHDTTTNYYNWERTKAYIRDSSGGGGGGSDTSDIHYFTSDYTIQNIDGNIALQLNTSSGSYTLGNPFTTYITLDELSSTMSTNADIEAGYITAFSGITSGDPTKNNHVDYTSNAGLNGQYLRYNTDHSTSWEYVDTFLLSTKSYRQKAVDSLNSIIATKGSGTVTSVIGGYGTSGNTISTSGTLSIDTSLMATKLRVQKAIDSLNSIISNVPSNVSNINLLAITVATTTATYAVATTATFLVSGYIAITAVTTDVIEFRVTWTDENSTSQTQKFYPMGVTTSGLSTTGFTPFSPATIRAKNGTNIVIATVLTTGIGSITYDVGSLIQKI